MRRALALGLALVAAPLFAEEPAPIPVAFELLPTQHMVVKVKLNGKGPYRLIFDTGAPMLLVNNKIAKEAGLVKDKKKPAGLSPFGAVSSMTIDKLELGELKADKVPTMVMDHPTVALISEAYGPIEGLIGFPFFARYKTTVDYQAKQLTFAPSDYQPGDMMQNLMDTMMANSKAKGKPGPRILVPAAQWGLECEKAEGDEAAGVTIKAVLADGAAAKAGLKAGDRLLTLDGRWTDSIADLFHAASLIRPGQSVVAVLQRGGTELRVRVTPTAGQ